LRTIDAHAAGEPLRVLAFDSGFPKIPGDTILAKRRYAREHLDHLRRALMFEPRGHADMYGAILTEPVTPDGDLGVLFTHNEGYSTMCGHGIIALTTVVFETGMLPANNASPVLRLDTPAGRVTARAEWELQQRRVRAVTFENVPSYVVAIDQTVDVPGLGAVRYDLAFGGAYYAYCEAEALGLRLTGEDFRALIEIGMRIKHAVAAARVIEHPFKSDLGFLYGTIICGAPHGEGAHSRNVCIFAEGEVDRSPTGTGVSGRVAIEHARRRLREGEPFVVESILGTRFTGRVARAMLFGSHNAVIPEVSGSAWITGQHEFLIAPDDPLREGFMLR
jgi:trans-L-3-hydroxyproline dehydratase